MAGTYIRKTVIFPKVELTITYPCVPDNAVVAARGIALNDGTDGKLIVMAEDGKFFEIGIKEITEEEAHAGARADG